LGPGNLTAPRKTPKIVTEDSRLTFAMVASKQTYVMAALNQTYAMVAFKRTCAMDVNAEISSAINVLTRSARARTAGRRWPVNKPLNVNES